MENEKQRQLEILVVEDQPKYREAAKKFFYARDDVQVSYTDNSDKALEDISEVDGALIDVFMQGSLALKDRALKKLAEYQTKGNEERYYKSFDSIRKDIGNEGPIGLVILEKAEELDIPYVLVSSLFHHNMKLEAVTQFMIYSGRNMNFREGNDGFGEEPTLKEKEMEKEFYKDYPEYWEKAYEQLSKQFK